MITHTHTDGHTHDTHGQHYIISRALLPQARLMINAFILTANLGAQENLTAPFNL